MKGSRNALAGPTGLLYWSMADWMVPAAQTKTDMHADTGTETGTEMATETGAKTCTETGYDP